MSRMVRRMRVGLGVLCATLLMAQAARAQDEVVSVSRRAYGPNDVGRVVDANWNPVGRTSISVDVVTFAGPGIAREVRDSLAPGEATANASAFPSAAAMRRAEASGYIRVTDMETVYQVAPDSQIVAPDGSVGQFYIHAVLVGRVYQRQFFGSSEAVSAAVASASEGQGISSSVRSARLLRGYRAPRIADEARLLGTADADGLRALLRSSGRARGVLVIFRRIQPRVSESMRGRIALGAPVAVPLIAGGSTFDGYDPGTINRWLQTRRAVLLRCYEQGLRRDPTLRGQLVLTFTITPEGRLVDVAAASPTLPDEVTRCVSTMVARFRVNPVPEESVRFESRVLLQPLD
jgi:hypothetical protein